MTSSATTLGFSTNPNTSPSPAKNTASNQASGNKNSSATGNANLKKSSYASMLPKMTSSEAEVLEEMMGVYTDDTNAFFQEKAREAFQPTSTAMQQGKSSIPQSNATTTSSSMNAQVTSWASRWNSNLAVNVSTKNAMNYSQNSTSFWNNSNQINNSISPSMQLMTASGLLYYLFINELIDSSQ